MRLSVETTPGSVFDRFAGAQPTLSPDGTRIVVSEYDPTGKSHMAIRRLDQGQFVPIAGTDNARSPCFSPDGDWIAFFADGKLKKVAVQGGAYKLSSGILCIFRLIKCFSCVAGSYENEKTTCCDGFQW